MRLTTKVSQQLVVVSSRQQPHSIMNQLIPPQRPALKVD